MVGSESKGRSGAPRSEVQANVSNGDAWGIRTAKKRPSHVFQVTGIMISDGGSVGVDSGPYCRTARPIKTLYGRKRRIQLNLLNVNHQGGGSKTSIKKVLCVEICSMQIKPENVIDIKRRLRSRCNE